MIQTRKNYEQVLMDAAGNNPALPVGKLLDCLENKLGIKLAKYEKSELTSFAKERSGASGLKLVTFLAAVGLPAQLLGAASVP
jgi:hypothetical protein